MGGRTATILIVGAGLAAMLVLGWSIASAFSLVDATPYWVGSLSVTLVVAAALLMLKDLVLWPFKKLGPIIERLRAWVAGLLGGGDKTPARPPQGPPSRPAIPREADAVPRPRRQH